MKNSKVSVIIPTFNNEKTIKRCLDSVLSQTYRNIEIIVVDDGSTDKTVRIIKKLQREYPEIILLCHNKHKGLYHTRIDAVTKAIGDYIAMVDGGDYIPIDYIRTIVSTLEETNADIAISDIVEELDNRLRTIPSLAYNNMQFDELRNDDILNRYFEQEGLNYLWAMVESKICKKEVWIKSLPYLKQQTKCITAGENIAFSSVLMYFAKKVTKVNGAPYYCHNPLKLRDIVYDFKSLGEELSDTTTAFLSVKKFLSDIKADKKFFKYISKWQCLYRNIYTEYINKSEFTISERDKLQNLLNIFCNKKVKLDCPEYFYQVQTDWNDGYERVKEQIVDSRNKIISFDIFDTLVLRPFYKPTDLFELMNDEFHNITGGTFSDFSTIRIEAERKARENLRNGNSRFEEITLIDIYDVIANEYKITRIITRQMYDKEIELEIKYCKTRKSVHQLYELAHYIGKKIVFISDMYLPQSTVEKILKRTNYVHYEKLYLSSEQKLTKSVSSLYEHVIDNNNAEPSEILHIGDDDRSDYQNAIKYGIKAIRYPSTKDAFTNSASDLYRLFFKNLPFWQNNVLAFDNLTIRLFLALMVNEYFDNPYKTFNSKTDFNCDPRLIGYGAFGMFLFGLVDWLIKDASRKKYNKIAFMSRDGYMPMLAYRIMAPHYDLTSPKEKYFYTSRQANLFATIQNEFDIFKLDELIMRHSKTPKQLVPFLKNIFEDLNLNELEKLLNKDHRSINDKIRSKSEFWELIRLCREYFLDIEKNIKKTDMIKEYVHEQLGENFCIFDIGYSAKPEMYLSKLLDKKVDAYFVHGDSSSGKHSAIGGFELNTFYDYTPQIYALLDELLISKQSGLCTGYKVVNGVVKPIFNKYNPPYQESSMIREIQGSALQIIRDVLNIVDVNTKRSNQKFYYSMMYNTLLLSNKKTDMLMFSGIKFEDSIFSKDKFDLVDYWNLLKIRRNQHPLSEIYDISDNNES